MPTTSRHGCGNRHRKAEAQHALGLDNPGHHGLPLKAVYLGGGNDADTLTARGVGTANHAPVNREISVLATAISWLARRVISPGNPAFTAAASQAARSRW
jgi:hypothetical protein